MDEEKPPAKPRRLARFVLWTGLGPLLALLVAAVGFYLWYSAEVRSSNERVDPEVIAALEERAADLSTSAANLWQSTTSVASTTTVTTPPAPDSINLVLLGSDTRSVDGKGGRSDTIILVHIDPTNDYLSMLSIPRDLRVKIPGHGYNKINAAYAYGGAALLIRTIQSSLGIELQHYAETDFTGFKTITDALGGVYMDVDRTYDDGKIQLQPGYQLLGGQDALRFCRSRHDKNIDFGRMQRQQRFISAVREQAMGWNLALKLPSLLDSVFASVDTDLSANEILKLAWWGVRLDGSRMKMATLVTSTGTIKGVSYVLATDSELAQAAADFLTPPAGEPGETADESPQVMLASAERLLSDSSGEIQGEDAWGELAGAAGFPLLRPTYIPPKCQYAYQRSYAIQVDGKWIPAVKVGYRLSTKDQYLGVGATTWLDAPLASSGKGVIHDGILFTIVGSNAKTDHIWWVKDEVLYWVTNTLMYELTREELLAVAISSVPAPATQAVESARSE